MARGSGSKAAASPKTAPSSASKRSKPKSTPRKNKTTAGANTIPIQRSNRKKDKKLGRKNGTDGGDTGGGEDAGEMEIIDMTALDDDDDEEGEYAGRSKGQIEGNGDPGPSTMRSRSAAAAMSSSSTPSKRPNEAIYTPTAFKPMKRSMVSGLGRMPSSPPAELALPVKIEASSNQHPTADMVITEKAISPGDVERPDGVSEHFDPPGLFSTTLIPTTAEQLDGARKTSVDPSEGKKEAVALPLLLPEHVQIDDVLLKGGAAVDSRDTDEADGDDSMEGLHFIDTDVTRGATRYFDPDAVDEPQGDEATFLATADQSKICSNCKKPGHKQKDCPHTICTTCGEMDTHERRDCPFGLTCYACGMRGHRQQNCPNPVSKSARRQGCDRCGARDHKDNSCPSLWRSYVYLSAAARQSILSAKRAETGWSKEAVGSDNHLEWCYNCAKSGHLGDDCPSRRGSLAYLTTPSAFSAQISSSGPFARISNRNGRGPRANNAGTGTPTHQRFDAEDEGEEEAFKTELLGLKTPFEGLQAGRKTREKAKKRAAELDAAAGSDDSDDEGIAFVGSSRAGRGVSIRGRGRGGGSQRGTPVNRNGPSRRAWDSERRDGSDRAMPMRAGDRDGNMPFGHAHLMSSNAGPSSAPAKPKGIVFGNIAGLPARPASPSPNIATPSGGPSGDGSDRGQTWKNRASRALIERALGYSSAPASRDRSPINAPSPLSQNGDTTSPRKRRRKQEDPSGMDDRDFEAEWRSKGNGGGNVREWGEEEDRLDRQERREGREGKGDGGSRYGIKGGLQGLSVRGAAAGERSGSRGGPGRGGGTSRGGKSGPATPVGQRYRGGY